MITKKRIRPHNRQWFTFIIFVTFAWILVNTGHAQETQQAESHKNCLWSMETKENLIYFLGSIHILRSDSYPLADEIERAYSDSKTIVFETDLDGMNDPALQAKMVTLGLYPNGRTLEQNISEETFELLKENVERAALSLAQFSLFRPWLCALTLASTELQRLGFDPRRGIDAYFFDKAKRDGKKTVFLESVEYQLNLLAGMKESDQELFLRQTLKDLEVVETMAFDMVDFWENGDADRLNAMIKLSFTEYPDIYHRLIIQRNTKWVLDIENLIHEHANVLIIVGAGHLIGPEGILESLRKKGYEITQR